MDMSELLNSENLYAVFSEPKEIQEQLKALWIERLDELKASRELKNQVKQMFKAFTKADDELAKAYEREYAKTNSDIPLAFDGRGQPLTSIDNFISILRNDPKFKTLQFNLLSYAPEHIVDGKIERWVDKDDSATRLYIEKKYKIHSENKLNDALRVYFAEKEYHPIKEKIESIQWDGVHRIETLFIKWLKCDDTPYTREVTRLVFAGGIHRLYNPGCKFDDVAVLIGTKQGEGKSTFVRWLAMNDEWFTEVSDFDGEKAMQALEGAWVCEISELLALTRTREIEAAKAFITRLNDRRKIPYDRRVTDHKRQCVFIGTTNKEQFLRDLTGNRRWYPLKVNSSGYDLFDKKEEIQADICQCWAEAKALYDDDKLKPYARRDLLNEIKQQQARAVEDDYRIGMIEKYLETKDRVCVLELWQNALNNDFVKPSRRESNEITLIMQNFPEWKRIEKPIRDNVYGVQRFWQRNSKTVPPIDDDDELNF